jgi:hypothetical protein
VIPVVADIPDPPAADPKPAAGPAKAAAKT